MLLLSSVVRSTIIHKIFGTCANLGVKYRTYGKGLTSVFQEFFASINKIFILAGRLGTRLFLIFWDLRSYVVRQLVRQLVYTVFISNNRAFDNREFW